MRTWSFAKGHGTENDFILLKDRSGLLNPSAADVRFLCDRRRGVGADGLLRAIRSERVPDWPGPPGLWFMDYRNADGTVAEICGNGLRVFAQWLLEEDLATGAVIQIATRAGLRQARAHADGRISVTMGTPRWDPAPTPLLLSGRTVDAHAVDVGNPHCVVPISTTDDLAALDLGDAEPDAARFPDGTNVEFVVAVGPSHLRLRVRERGVGETRSCGSGVVAAACDHRQRTGNPGCTYRVDVPGGRLTVDFDADGAATLTGPACVVARGEVTLPDD